jgi:DNA-binding transcriptional regulator YhcF (GntR family)
MKSSKEIRNYILKNGQKRTNAEMAEKLGVARMTFAGVLAAMKRKGEISNNFLKSDVVANTPKATKTTSNRTTAKRVTAKTAPKATATKATAPKTTKRSK